MTGSPSCSSGGGDQSFDWSIRVVANYGLTGNGDTGSYTVATHSASTSNFFRHAWGVPGSISFEIDRTATNSSSNSNVLTLDADPSLDDTNTSSSNYHFTASGASVNGVPSGIYTLDGHAANHYSFHDGTIGDTSTPPGSPPTGTSFKLAYSKDRSYTVDESTDKSTEVSAGTDSYNLNVKSVNDYGGGADQTVKFDDDFSLTSSHDNSASGIADGVTLDTGGSDSNSLNIWEGAGEADDPNACGYPDYSGSQSGSGGSAGASNASGWSSGSGSNGSPQLATNQAGQGGPVGTTALDQRHA